MSRYRVTPEEIKNVKEQMLEMTKEVNSAFEQMMSLMSKLGDYFVNSKTADVVEILGIRKLDFLSTQANLVRTINTLDDIANEYSRAEKENIDELHSID